MPIFTFDATWAMMELRRSYVKKISGREEVTVEDFSAPIAFSLDADS